MKSVSTRRWVTGLLSYLIAAGCLYWIFHDVQWRELLQTLGRVDWVWTPLSIFCGLLTYVCVAWQWQFLLRPLGRLSLPRLAQAVFAGRFANDVLPVHMGYVIRVYLAARWMGKDLAAVVPSLVVERLFDGFWMALGIGITALFVPLPGELLRAAEVLGGTILGGTGVLVFLLWRRHQRMREGRPPPHARWKVLRRAQTLLDRMAGGVAGIARSPWLGMVVVLSLSRLLLQALAFLPLLWAYGFRLPLSVQFAVFLIAFVGLSLPSTPASAGVFQLFCVAGLTLFHVPRPAATGFALLAFVILTVPLSLAGFVAVARSGMTLRQLRAAAEQAQR